MQKRILYGVDGEGLGHAFRSKVLLTELVKQHTVKIVSWDRSYQLLSRSFEDVEEITGPQIVYEGNHVSRYNTVKRNVTNYVDRGGWRNLVAMARIRDKFKPDVVISDFDPFSNFLALIFDLPVASVDNMHVISRCKIEVPPGYERDYYIAKTVTAAMNPGADHYFITSFFAATPLKRKTTMVPPILREELLALTPTTEDYILVYHTVPHFEQLLKVFEETGGSYVVYGFNRDETLGSITLRPLSEDGFLRDLAGARAVVTGGGFTLITEALQFGKPVYSIPVRGQFEQVLNAYYLARLGYGEFHEKLDPTSLLEFQNRLPTYSENLRSYRRTDNTQIFAAVNDFISNAG